MEQGEIILYQPDEAVRLEVRLEDETVWLTQAQIVVGVGVGGTFEKCALMAKEALTREVGTHSEIEWVKDLEEEILQKINNLGIGPGGLGGTTTALAVNVNTYPTHIAGLPVAIKICCHVNRHIIREV